MRDVFILVNFTPMKKSIFILFFILIIIPITKSQNRFKVGLKAGLSTTQVEGDTYAGFNKAGFDGGLFVNGKINDKWSAQFEMLFVQKGSKHNSNPEKGDFTFYLMQLNYIEVPVLFQYHQKKFTFELGPGFGYLVSNKEFDFYGGDPYSTPFQTTEISASIGISYLLNKRLGINWRYTNSLLPIRKFSSVATYGYNPGQRNNVLAFTLTYQFGNAATE